MTEAEKKIWNEALEGAAEDLANHATGDNRPYFLACAERIRAMKIGNTEPAHRLTGNTLYNERGGIIGRCACGWDTGYHMTVMIASGAFQDHIDKVAA